MSPASIPAVVMASITSLVAGLYLVLYLRLRPRNRELLSFALLSLTVAAYDVLCAGLYSAASVAEGVPWQRLQSLVQAAGTIALLVFVEDYTGRRRQWVRWALVAASLPVLVGWLLAPALLWTGQPLVKHVGLPFGLAVTYCEGAPGPLNTYESAFILPVFAYLLVAALRYHPGRGGRAGGTLLAAMGLFCVAVVNDTAVSVGLYPFLYTLEYGFLALVGLMGSSLVRELVRARQTERALEESEARFRTLVETTSDWVWEMDREGAYTYSSPSVRGVLGYEPEELLGRARSELMPPAEGERFAQLYRGHLERGASFALVRSLCLRRDGRLVLLESSGVPTRDASGRLLGFRGIDRDVTQHKRADDALRESETRFRTLAENVPGVIYLCRHDARPTMLYLNDAVESLTGYRKEEFLEGRISFGDLYHPDDTERIRAGEAGALARHQPFRVVYRLRHHRGDWRWIEEVGVGVDQGDGQLLLEGFLSDITARKRAEEALRESEERYRQLVEASPSGILLLSAEARVLFANPAAVAILGATAVEELVGRNILDLVPTEQRGRVVRRIEAVLGGAVQLTTTEEELQRLDGQPIHVTVAGVGVVHEGAPAALVVGTDITDRKRAERERVRLESQLLHAQKMEAVGRLAGGVAHDFNNLLQAMLSHVETLVSVADRPDRVRCGLAELQERTRRGAQLTRQLLLFSRRESARRELLDLNSAVRETAELSRHLLPETIELSLELAEEPLEIVADRGQVEQVVMNLALNAADAMAEGGRLTLRTGGAGKGRVVLEVADSGCGIEPTIRDRVFEPFFTTKAPGEGSGLGLSVVHGIVTAHGGEVELESEVGHGTTFRVILPRAPAEAGAELFDDGPVTPVLYAPRGRGERILVVEDEGDTRDALCTILDTIGYRAVGAGCGEEARRLPAEPAFEVLLTDLLLPDCRGNELARDLAQRWPGLKVILMSGYAQDPALRDEVAQGAVAFLQKPFPMAALARRIRAALTDGGQP